MFPLTREGTNDYSECLKNATGHKLTERSGPLSIPYPSNVRIQKNRYHIGTLNRYPSQIPACFRDSVVIRPNNNQALTKQASANHRHSNISQITSRLHVSLKSARKCSLHSESWHPGGSLARSRFRAVWADMSYCPCVRQGHMMALPLSEAQGN